MLKFSKKTRPFSELTRKDLKFKWGPEEQYSFNLIKQSLLDEPVLKLFDASRTIELHIDAFI